MNRCLVNELRDEGITELKHKEAKGLYGHFSAESCIVVDGGDGFRLGIFGLFLAWNIN
jgi:hypothetical protein